MAGHGYVELECDGMDLDRIQTALRRIIADNDQLRMVVRPNLQQQVLAEVPDYQIKIYDLREMSEDEADAQLASVRDRMSHEILPADQWPILRFAHPFEAMTVYESTSASIC
ncbi:hypothetical protein [Alkalilimnicola ehrlichii]|uniref:hypothetical protein n=1 Tax=Alkalilimnicola ehrlichii TaxID=351052 RepID=UPI0015F29949|nr:hypothetical protein [Alkalilimnicola ehrlichii]